VFVSGHGLGHASRMIELLNTLGARAPDLRLAVRTSAPRWLFDLSARVPFEVHACDTDVGMVQIDSLRLDERATARRAAEFHATFGARADAEAAWLRRERAGAVVGDIPPLAFAAAARAGLPSLAIGNFTWDWIYEAYPAFDELAPEVLPEIRSAYAAASRALRLPFHGGFAPMAGRIRDIPLIARRSTREPLETRRVLGLGGGRPIVLASFGAYGATLPYAAALADGRLTVVTTDRDRSPVPDGLPPGALVRLELGALHARGLHYEDIVAAADVVLTKPGYGIVSECVANRTAVLYTTRGEFREQEALVADMPKWLRARHLPRADLLAGRWADAVEALVAQPDPPERPGIDGAEVAAEEILGMIARRS
jgi:L-arabinokinase